MPRLPGKLTKLRRNCYGVVMRLDNRGPRMKRSDTDLAQRYTALCRQKKAAGFTQSQRTEMVHVERELRARGVLGDEPVLVT